MHINIPETAYNYYVHVAIYHFDTSDKQVKGDAVILHVATFDLGCQSNIPVRVPFMCMYIKF